MALPHLYPDLKLGRLPAKHDPRTLLLASYLDLSALPFSIPDSCDYSHKVQDWGMLCNDRVGDCTVAAAGHLIMSWAAYNNKQAPTVNDGTVMTEYEALTGYNPQTRINDTGCYELNVLNRWVQTGICGHKIAAYVAIEPKNATHIKASVYLFGGAYIGISCPKTMATQEIWSVPPQGPVGDGTPGGWGGHAVCIVAYDENYLTCVTWGRLVRMTWGFWNTYVEESYAILSGDWAEGTASCPNGFNFAQLMNDLALVQH